MAVAHPAIVVHVAVDPRTQGLPTDDYHTDDGSYHSEASDEDTRDKIEDNIDAEEAFDSVVEGTGEDEDEHLDESDVDGSDYKRASGDETSDTDSEHEDGGLTHYQSAGNVQIQPVGHPQQASIVPETLRPEPKGGNPRVIPPQQRQNSSPKQPVHRYTPSELRQADQPQDIPVQHQRFQDGAPFHPQPAQTPQINMPSWHQPEQRSMQEEEVEDEYQEEMEEAEGEEEGTDDYDDLALGPIVRGQMQMPAQNQVFEQQRQEQMRTALAKKASDERMAQEREEAVAAAEEAHYQAQRQEIQAQRQEIDRKHQENMQATMRQKKLAQQQAQEEEETEDELAAQQETADAAVNEAAQRKFEYEQRQQAIRMQRAQQKHADDELAGREDADWVDQEAEKTEAQQQAFQQQQQWQEQQKVQEAADKAAQKQAAEEARQFAKQEKDAKKAEEKALKDEKRAGEKARMDEKKAEEKARKDEQKETDREERDTRRLEDQEAKRERKAEEDERRKDQREMDREAQKDERANDMETKRTRAEEMRESKAEDVAQR